MMCKYYRVEVEEDTFHVFKYTYSVIKQIKDKVEMDLFYSILKQDLNIDVKDFLFNQMVQNDNFEL